MPRDFIGAGWAFPLRIDATGGIALVTQAREIEQAIGIILRTAPGERPMRPEFGCRIQDHVFAPANAATAAAIAYDVRAALERWEPRIDVEDVRVSFDAAGRWAPSTSTSATDPRRQRRTQPGLPVLRHPRRAGRATGRRATARCTC